MRKKTVKKAVKKAEKVIDTGEDTKDDIAGDAEINQAISGAMLEALVCPISGGALQYEAKKSRLISRKAKCAFPIRGGIPIMLVSESEALD